MTTRFGTRLLLPLALGSMSSMAQADIRAFAGLGYDSVSIKADSTTDNKDRFHGGLSYELLGQADVFGPLPGLDIFVGGGLRGHSLKWEGDNSAKSTWTGQMITGEAGVNFGLIPLLTLQGALGYDHGIGGEVKSEVDLLGVKRSGTNDVDSFTRIRTTGRAFLTPFPLLRLGAEVSLYPTGNVKFDVDNAKEQEVWGWGIMFMGGVSL